MAICPLTPHHRDELVIAVKRSGTPDSSPHRLVWCPHVGQVGMQPKEEGQARTDGSEGELARNKSSCSSDEDCLLIVASHGSQVSVQLYCSVKVPLVLCVYRMFSMYNLGRLYI